MEINFVSHGDTGYLYLEDNGERIGHMKLSFPNDHSMVIVTTVVKHQFKGQGLGRKLVDAAVNFAKEHGKTVSVECPYAKSVLSKSDQYKDLVIEDK